MNKKNLAIFTVGRSDFGILKNIIIKCEKDKRFNLYLVIGSAHNSKVFGNTFNEIKSIKIKKKFAFKFKYGKSSNKNITRYFKKTLQETKSFFENNTIDAAIVIGDRYEILAISLACLVKNIPIMHFGGGSVTLGSLDNIYRNTISKMASVHFLETEFHKKRLQKIGIKKNLNVVGAAALENINQKLIKKKKLFKELKLNFNLKKKLILACFHPETAYSIKYNLKNLKIFLNFLSNVDANIVLTYPNADAGYVNYIKLINNYLPKKNNIKIIKNLGITNYYSLLKISNLLIGNSSSGIIESSSFKLPTINLGKRQTGRLTPRNVINAKFSLKDINKSFVKALSKKFNLNIKKIKNPYFKKSITNNSLNIIYKYLNK